MQETIPETYVEGNFLRAVQHGEGQIVARDRWKSMQQFIEFVKDCDAISAHSHGLQEFVDFCS